MFLFPLFIPTSVQSVFVIPRIELHNSSALYESLIRRSAPPRLTESKIHLHIPGKKKKRQILFYSRNQNERRLPKVSVTQLREAGAKMWGVTDNKNMEIFLSLLTSS